MKKGGEIIKCKVKGCPSKKRSLTGFCARHYWQIKNFGVIKGNPKQSLKTPNEFIMEGSICRIKLYNRLGEEIAEAIIDAEDYSKVKGYKWGIQSPKGHVKTYLKGKNKGLANIVLGKDSSRQVQIDHKDRNPLNNKKDNLRFCSHKQNGWNRGPNKNNSSGLKGISRCKNKWRVMIQRQNNKPIYSKTFDSKELAVEAYNQKIVEIQGRFAYTNPTK